VELIKFEAREMQFKIPYCLKCPVREGNTGAPRFMIGVSNWIDVAMSDWLGRRPRKVWGHASLNLWYLIYLLFVAYVS